MCGIAGHSCWGDYDKRLDIVMPILALHMETRGRKSWGWTDGRDQIIKEVGEISDGFNPSFLGYREAALHTRQPTTGGVTKENSHPFQIGDVIGMHNGVVRNHTELQNKYKRNVSVDSEHIFYHINENRSLHDISAYGAIVFWRDGKLYLGRFNGGELSLCKTETSWVFASTKVAVETALRMSGLTKGAKFFNLLEDKLYRIDGEDVAVDSKLDFGHYNVATYGGWEGSYSSYGTDSTDWEAHGVWSNITDSEGKVIKRLWTPASGNVVTPQVTGFVNSRTPTIILPESISNEGRYQSTDQRIMELIKAAAETVNHNEHTGENWPCGRCNSKLFEGDKFFMSDDDIPALLCEVCAGLDKESIVGSDEALTELPLEIGLVSSFFGADEGTSGAEMECEACGDKLAGNDFFVHTKSKEFVCVQCFAGGGVEFEVQEDDSRYQEYAEFIAREDGELVEVPTVEAVANEAYQERARENLLQLEDMTQDGETVPFVQSQIR